MKTKTLRQLGEFGLIRKIQQQAKSAEHLVLGIGDDCAIQQSQEGYQLLTSTDLLIEGVHFERRWTSMEQLGRKAAAVNLSDIAAMGGVALSLFLAVGCPAEITTGELDDFCRGFLAETERHGAVLAGGDTCRSKGPLIISVTVQGQVAAGQAIRRAGARPGDAIYVSGTLGDSALALHDLLHGKQPPPECAERHHCPQARLELGSWLAKSHQASAMLDVSDGLLADLQHILDASGVGAVIELDTLPLSAIFRLRLATEPALLELALNGGEDYELLLTSAEQQLARQEVPPPGLTRIGRIVSEAGLQVRQPDGSLYPSTRGGFDHFA